MSAVVLVDGVIFIPQESVRLGFEWSKGFLRDRETWTRSFLEKMAMSADVPDIPDKLFAESMVVPGPSAYGLLLEYLLSDSRQALVDLAIPVFYVHCPKLAPLAPLVQATLPTAKVVSVDEAGHMLFFDAANGFNDTISAFCENVKDER